MLALLAAGLVALCLWVLWVGRGYYLLDRLARVDHPLHVYLDAGAGGGVALGLLGTGLMVAMQLYTVRKKLPRQDWLGRLDLWLRFHIICGVMGPVLIVLHGGVQFPRGLISVGFWCMVAVGLSGTFGRYVYGFFPRRANGKALAWNEALTELLGLRAELVAATAGTRSHAVGEAVQLVEELEFEADSVGDLLRLNREVRRRRAKIIQLVDSAQLPDAARTLAIGALDTQLDLKRGLESSRVVYRLFRYWHLFHRPLAWAMYVIIAFHVASAILLGGSLAELPNLLTF